MEILGSHHPSTLTSVRILMLSTLILSMLIYQFYSASIVSSLLMQPVALLTSLKDILHSTIKLGCEDILYIRDFFLVSRQNTIFVLMLKVLRFDCTGVMEMTLLMYFTKIK